MNQSAVVSFLSEAGNYPHSSAKLEHIETHISHIFLAGDYAYKLKKALALPFLDFSTLERRKHYCMEELRLNRRYAPNLYLSVESLVPFGAGFRWSASGQPAEYLVRMCRFDSEDLLSHLLDHGQVEHEQMRLLVDKIALFHGAAEKTPGYFGFEAVSQLMNNCVTTLEDRGYKGAEMGELGLLISASLEQHKALICHRAEHHIRELHGDLHTNNICLFEGDLTPFDGIEFGREYSCMDPWADIAFLIMDLQHRGWNNFAALVWNRYLEVTGDYDGLSLLRLYIVYRALVRAKIAAIRDEQEHTDDRLQLEVSSYLQLAKRIIKGSTPRVLVLGGLSGSGKTTVAQYLAERDGGVHLRSDVLRKQLAGVPPEEPLTAEHYTSEWSDRTYERLYALAEQLVDSGFSVIVDAVHNSELVQQRAIDLVAKGVSGSRAVWCEVPEDTAVHRVQTRRGDASDANVAVVRGQFENAIIPRGWQRLSCDRSIDLILDQIPASVSPTL